MTRFSFECYIGWEYKTTKCKGWKYNNEGSFHFLKLRIILNRYRIRIINKWGFYLIWNILFNISLQIALLAKILVSGPFQGDFKFWVDILYSICFLIQNAVMWHKCGSWLIGECCESKLLAAIQCWISFPENSERIFLPLSTSRIQEFVF